MNIFISFLTLSLIIGGGITTPKEPESIATLIKENIDEFNSSQKGRGKQETNFSSVTNIFNVFNEKGKAIGELLIFDNNDGYLFVGVGNYVRDHNYAKGFDVNICDSNVEYLIFDGNNYYDNSMNLIHSRVNKFIGNGDTMDLFYWHADNTFMTEKERELLTELSPRYDTLANVTSSSFFGNKIMWSSQQGVNNCAQVAISNLLWSYKMNEAITLPGYCNTYDNLLENVNNFVPLDYGQGEATSTSSIENINNMFSFYNYIVDDVSVVNGISDSLQYGPLIAFYKDPGDEFGHFALVTGKGRSVYKKILSITLYTSWDIVNTYRNYNETAAGYLAYKYWVDNQYILCAWQLEYSSTGNIIPLING